MTNDCGELLKSLKGRSEAAQLETAVNLASVWQVHCFLIVFLSPPWLHWTICRKNCRCESSAKIMIALGSHSIQSCSGAVLGSELNERSHSVKSWENGWVPAKWEIAAGQYFFPPSFLSFKCEAVGSETKQSREMRSYLKNSINVDNCSAKFRQNKLFPPQ